MPVSSGCSLFFRFWKFCFLFHVMVDNFAMNTQKGLIFLMNRGNVKCLGQRYIV